MECNLYLYYIPVFVFIPLKGCQMPIATDIKLDFHNPPHLNARMWARPYQKVSHMAVATSQMTLRETRQKQETGDG